MTTSITRILVPVDFSTYADGAVARAATLATQFGAAIELLHVVDDPIVSGVWGSEGYIPNLAELRDSVVEDATRRLAAYRARLEQQGIRVNATVGTGRAAQTIVEYAGTRSCDLIVMGTHGRTGLAHMLIGSVAERVVRTAPCAVMTIRGTEVEADATATPVAAAPA